MKENQTTETLTALANIGEILAGKLAEAGITSYDDLVSIGSVEATLKIRDGVDPGACYNMLYAIEGAIREVRWHDISKEERNQLKENSTTLPGVWCRVRDIMIEMPEATTLARQMNDELTGKTITGFSRGTQTHKFLWLNRPDEEYETTLPGKTITGASSYGRSIYLKMGQENMLWWSDAGGKILYHISGKKLPAKCHLIWTFSDDSHLTYALQMWGAVKLLNTAEFNDLPHDETGVPPLNSEFTFERFNTMLDEYPEKTSKGIKGFLVATGYAIPNHIHGLGNAIVQDILFNARLNPKRKTPDIEPDERRRLYDAIQSTVAEAIDQGGRYDETDLYGNKGGYVRLMDSKTANTPCPNCSKNIQKISYLGGACYLCPSCQQ